MTMELPMKHICIMRTIEVEVTNGSNSGIAFGWSTSDFNMAVKTTAGTYNIPVNVLEVRRKWGEG